MSTAITGTSTGLPRLTRNQIAVTAGVMVAIAVAALDSTVVGTAMPTIIGQLGGLHQYAWVFSAYLVTSTTSVPIFSSLADAHGRKPVFLFGLAVFVVGSALCGLASSMTELIAFRALQGLGAGAVLPISFTIIGDTFEPRQRARMQGLFSAIWGLCAIIGPAIGGLITGTVGWRWVFTINIPVGLLAGLIIAIALHERGLRHERRIDWIGGALLTASIVLLLFVVSDAGQAFGWTSPLTIGLGLVAIALFSVFVRRSRSVAEPLIDLDLLRSPLIRAGLVITTLSGVVMFGVTTYVPPMVQGVQAGSPLEAGVAVAGMSVSWTVASILGGRALLRIGARPLVLGGTLMLLIGALLVTLLKSVDSLAYTVGAGALVGVGMGLVSTTLLVMVQGAVAWERRAVATGLIQFSRTIGGAVGVGVMGGILAVFVGTASSAVLDPAATAGAAGTDLETARRSLAAGLGVIYWVMTGCAALALVIAARTMPDVRLGHELADERKDGSVGIVAG